MLRIGAIVLHVSDTDRAGRFWAGALGYQHADDSDFLEPVDGAGPRLHLDDTDRTHLDLWTADAAEQQAEVERLVSLGATRVEWDYPDDADFVVLADPSGTLFCIIDKSA
ncbi:VOC family protein [Nocardioides sp. C4-1]|uniref:VOC family protein n=1 Tax=Nocardioides sp. C4-1 TaxID=3151851 RepID=UPI0032646616